VAQVPADARREELEIQLADADADAVRDAARGAARPHSMDAAGLIAALKEAGMVFTEGVAATKGDTRWRPPRRSHADSPGALIADGVALERLHAETASACRACAAGEACYARPTAAGAPSDLACLVHSCTLPFPPDTPRVVMPAHDLEPQDEEWARAEVDRLLRAGVVERLSHAESQDPTMVHFCVPVFVAPKVPPRVPAAARDAAMAGDTGPLMAAAAAAAEVALAVAGGSVTKADLDRVGAHHSLLAAASKPLGARMKAAALVARDVDAGKNRLVYDYRAPNDLLPDVPFTMPSLNDVIRGWGDGDYLYATDIRAGFHHCAMHPGHRKYLCFQFGTEEVVTTTGAGEAERRRAPVVYRWLRLPFGVKLAPAIFCAFSAALTELLRARGVDIIVTFVDDNIGRAPSQAAGDNAMATIDAVYTATNTDKQASKDKRPAQSHELLLGASFRARLPHADGKGGEADVVALPPAKLYGLAFDLHFLRLLLQRRSTAPAAAGDDVLLDRAWLQSLEGKLTWAAGIVFAGAAMLGTIRAVKLYGERNAGAGGHNLVRVQASMCAALLRQVEWWLQTGLTHTTRIMRAPPGGIRGGDVAVVQTDASGERDERGKLTQGFGGVLVLDALGDTPQLHQRLCWGKWAVHVPTADLLGQRAASDGAGSAGNGGSGGSGGAAGMSGSSGSGGAAGMSGSSGGTTSAATSETGQTSTEA
jgi:hypothetical protein